MRTIFIYLVALGGLQAGDYRQQLNVLGTKYNIKIMTQKFKPSRYARKWATWQWLNGSDEKQLKAFAQVFIEEWSKYRVDWVKMSELRKVFFVKNLAVIRQNRAAMPDAVADALYYDISYISDPDYCREVIHHEFFHIIDTNLYGWGPAYTKWRALNVAGFVYGKGGASAYGKPGVHKEHPSTGFVNGYSTYGPAEDRAEIYAWLFITKRYRKLKKFINTDTVLAAKVRAMKSFIKQRSPAMGPAYFKKLHH